MLYNIPNVFSIDRIKPNCSPMCDIRCIYLKFKKMLLNGYKIIITVV